MTRHLVGRVDDIASESLTRIEVGDKVICLARTAECGFRAIDDACTHEDISLSDGDLWGQDVECPAHGSRFNVVTGAVTGLPASRPAETYDVHVEDGQIFVDV